MCRLKTSTELARIRITSSPAPTGTAQQTDFRCPVHKPVRSGMGRKKGLIKIMLGIFSACGINSRAQSQLAGQGILVFPAAPEHDGPFGIATLKECLHRKIMKNSNMDDDYVIQ